MDFILLKSAACLTILLLFYKLVLEKQSFHKFKRFYLLAILLISIGIPFISFNKYVEVEAVNTVNEFLYLSTEKLPLLDIQPIEYSIDYWSILLWIVYGLGVIVFAFRFGINLYRLIKKIQTNEKLKKVNYTEVLLQQLEPPHTFFSYIFFNKEKIESNTIPKEVVLHEASHAKQKHSLDILFIELLQVVFWFNPLLYFIKKDIKLNHEFLADADVIKHGISSTSYKNILLEFSNPHQDYLLANTINYSSIKKRFTVMKTQTSKKRLWLSNFILLPLLGLMLYSFSSREVIEVPIQKNNGVKIENNISTNTKEIGATNRLMKEYKNFIKKYNKTKVIYGQAYERAVIIYDDIMSEAQRASVEKYPPRLIPRLDLSKTKPRQLTKKLFEDFKNAKNYAIWIDGEHVQNSKLNGYSYTDFVHYSGSIVHKNARNKEFPQPNQYHLYTKNGFKNTYEDSQLRRYNNATEMYSRALKAYLNGPQKDNSELKILYQKAYDIYNTFSTKDIEKHDIKMPPPIPAMYFDDKRHTARSIEIKALGNGKYTVNGLKTDKSSFTKTVYEFHQDISSEVRNRIINVHLSFADKETEDEVWFVYNALLDYGFHRLVTKNQEVVKSKGNTPFSTHKKIKQQNPPTKKEIDAYNAWAKDINEKITKARAGKGNYPIIKQKEIAHLKAIYDRMTDEQQKNAQSWPSFPPPPPAPQASKKLNHNIPPPPPPKASKKQVAEYNAWAKKLKDETEKAKTGKGDYPIIKQKELVKYLGIYDIMTEQQRAASAPNPISDKDLNVLKFPPPPPPVPVSPSKSKGGPNVSHANMVDNSCLEIPKAFETTSRNVLKIKCIENYKDNKFSVYNKWGNLIYSKENYNNNWNGSVDKSYAEIDNDKATSGTYYYVFESPKLDKQKVGYLQINNSVDLNTPIIKNNKSKGGPNANSYNYDTKVYSTSKKRRIYISVSKKGELAFVEGKLIDPKFKPVSITQIETFLNTLSKTELKNTFIFTRGKDLKTFRSKPSNTPEYDDDIEIYLIKSKKDESERTKKLLKNMSEKNSKWFAYELALENNNDLKSQTLELIKIFKKYKGINTTL